MIADLKPYADYKESGLPWLGQVPGHWETRRLRHACDMRVSNVDKHTKPGEAPVRLCNYVEVYKNERIRESTRFMVASASEDERTRFRLRKGDVVITKDSEQWNDIGVPSLVEFEAPDLVCGYHLAILRSRPGLHGSFLHRALECHFIAAQFHVEANGVTRYGLSHGAIQGVAIPLPPPAEQAAIVRFLDWANGRLERAIRAKRKVIALLNEQKQAIIHRAVTRGLPAVASTKAGLPAEASAQAGLDPSLSAEASPKADVPLKPSGIPWLGDIPQHWGVMPLKRTCSLVRDGTHLPPARTLTGFPLLSVRNMVGGRLVRRADDSFISKADFEQLNSSFVVRPNDVLMAIVGATLGKVAVVDDIGPFQIQRSVSILRPRSELMSHAFLATFLRSPRLQQHLWQSVAFSAQPGIYLGFVANIPVPVPPTVAEQVSICHGLQRELSPIDTAISRLEREIDLLREYRTRLVADVVTGKLDVREAAARLPEELAEPEVLGVIDDAATDERNTADEAEEAMTLDAGD
jgi:type I restriction enzyme S subunit